MRKARSNVLCRPTNLLNGLARARRSSRPFWPAFRTAKLVVLLPRRVGGLLRLGCAVGVSQAARRVLYAQVRGDACVLRAGWGTRAVAPPPNVRYGVGSAEQHVLAAVGGEAVEGEHLARRVEAGRIVEVRPAVALRRSHSVITEERRRTSRSRSLWLGGSPRRRGDRSLR